MPFQHRWENHEANFGVPLAIEVHGGAHVSFEILPCYRGSYVLVRRPNGVPGHVLPDHAHKAAGGLLYLCYDLIRWGESTGDCISRIVRDQIACSMVSYRAVHFYSFVHEQNQNWALTPCFTAELAELPKLSTEVSEVVVFSADTIPEDIAWWNAEQLRELMVGLV